MSDAKPKRGFFSFGTWGLLVVVAAVAVHLAVLAHPSLRDSRAELVIFDFMAIGWVVLPIVLIRQVSKRRKP